jgi:hypothetical protein
MFAHPRSALIAAFIPLLLSGCIARTAASVVTAPVRIVGGGVDMMTTSQSEADEKRGREMRKREERLGRLYRDYERNTEQCREGRQNACEQARRDYAEIEDLRAATR